MSPLKTLPVLNEGSARGDSAGLWRSLRELAEGRDKLAVAAEFAPGASAPPDGTSRRSVLQLMGASIALAGLEGCLKQPDEKVLPYTRQPEEVLPGNPLHFATASTLDGYATGLLVRSDEGRPTKIEGNPTHPSSLGATGVLEQATVLQLYDPNRARVVMERGSARAWRGFLAAIADKATRLREKQGEGLVFLSQPSTSPLIAHLKDRLRKEFPRARFTTWSAIPSEPAHAGAELAFGSAHEARYDLSRASVIAALDADPLCALPGNERHMRAFADGRVPGEDGKLGNRLYAIECALSVTGMNADHRLRVRPSGVQRFALALAGRLGKTVAALAGFAPLADAQALSPQEAKVADALARDLVRAGKAAVVMPGSRQPAVVHAVAHAINSALGSAAAFQLAPLLHQGDAGPQALRALAEDIRKGAVDTLVITANNPAYSAPHDLNFGKALSRVPTCIYRSLYLDETAESTRWFVPATHELESWGDARAHDGTVSFVQPLVAPLFGGFSEVEMLAALLGEGDKSAYQQLKDFWRAERPGKDFESRWEKWLSDGFIPDTAAPALKPAVRMDAVVAAARAVPLPPEGGIELNVVPDYKVWDGRFGNVSWLQELPDPVTKLTWENAALVSPATARELSLATGDLVDLGLRGPSVRAPVLVVPGHADSAVTVALGYGRRGAEEIARDVGFSAANLRHADAPWFDAGLTVTPVGETVKIAQTQEHHSMEGRAIALTWPREKERVEENRGPLPTVHKPVDYSTGYRWAMAIDLSRCTGCSACMVACQSENNVPVVGKEQVWRSREMHWLRVDRYFTGNEDDPGVVVQPMMCQHCETAPCEYVCPVNATVHSDEGLNEMVYNRCVGTRYCSNNCPYKVRRFNFFSYTSDYSDVERMHFNPDVTVRARGVMEKCTYCVQRIERARITTRVEERGIRDGDLVTACQQVCPARAITFGNLNEPGAQVAKLHQDERRYDVLHELNTRPRTAYLARAQNPNPELA